MVWKYIKVFLFLGGAPFIFCACFATQDDVGVLKTQVAALNKTLQDLQKSQADNAVQSDELMTRLIQATDNIENFDYKLDAISSKLDDMQANGVSSNSMSPSDIFSEAKKQFDNKKYDEALKGFSLYLKDTSNTGLNSDQAYLYSAKIYLEKEDYQAAALSSATMLDKFPKSKYISAARLVYAKSIIHLDKKEEAKNYLKSIVQDFKKSADAKEAQKLLKEIE